MPPNFFQKPETALKRAQELISVGKELDALETLHDTIKVQLLYGFLSVKCFYFLLGRTLC